MKSRLLHAALAVSVLGLSCFPLSASARDIVLPAGTLLQCTLNEPNLSTATVDVGDPVLCHLRGVTEFGQQAFPRGSYLVGHLDSAKDPGHFWGKGYLKLSSIASACPPATCRLRPRSSPRAATESTSRAKSTAKDIPSVTLSNGCFLHYGPGR